MTVPITSSSRVGDQRRRGRRTTRCSRRRTTSCRLGLDRRAARRRGPSLDQVPRSRRRPGDVDGTADSRTTSPFLLICGGVRETTPVGGRQRVLQVDDARVGAAGVAAGRGDHVGQLVLQLLGLLLLLLGLLLLRLELVGLLLERVALRLERVALLLQLVRLRLQGVALLLQRRRACGSRLRLLPARARRPWRCSAFACCWSCVGLRPGACAACAASCSRLLLQRGELLVGPSASRSRTRGQPLLAAAPPGAGCPWRVLDALRWRTRSRASSAASSRPRAAGSSAASASAFRSSAACSALELCRFCASSWRLLAASSVRGLLLQRRLLRPGAGRPAAASEACCCFSSSPCWLSDACWASSCFCCCSSCFCCLGSSSAPCSSVLLQRRRLVVLLGVLGARRRRPGRASRRPAAGRCSRRRSRR